jgi:hypothetical protein
MTSPAIEKFRVTVGIIPEERVEGKRLGRHIRRDSRSLRYLVPETDAASLAPKKWERTVGPFDQGIIGSCVGNAGIGNLATEPFVDTLSDRVASGEVVFDEAAAIRLYSAATATDGYEGTYPPTDTGTDGLAAAQVLKEWGWISGYQHALDLTAMITALQYGPVMVGVNWYQGFDHPDSTGLVQITGRVRGGHEFEVNEVDLDNKIFTCVNSWGPGWGLDGTFRFSFDTMSSLFAQEGDCVQLVPLDKPAPVPTPVAETDDQKLWDVAEPWTTHRRYRDSNDLKKALLAWGEAKGL